MTSACQIPSRNMERVSRCFSRLIPVLCFIVTSCSSGTLSTTPGTAAGATPTKTPGSVHTPQATPSPTAPPTVPASSVLLYDDFDNPDSGWPVFGDAQTAQVGYGEGVFRIAFYSPGGFQAAWSPDRYGDFIVETEFSVPEGTNAGGGLTLRASDQNWYLVLIYPDTQEYSLWKTVAGAGTQIVEHQHSAAIQPEQMGGSLLLRLRAIVHEDSLAIWVSSPSGDYALLDAISDRDLALGHLGPAAVPPDGSFEAPIEMLFDWIRVSAYEEQPGAAGEQTEVPGMPTSGWSQSNADGFGNADNIGVFSLGAFDDHLYAGTRNVAAGAEIWRLENGGWTPVMQGGFGSGANQAIVHLLEFKGQLYASTWNQYSDTASYGAEIWRSSDGEHWVRVVSAGFGNPNNGEMVLGEFDGQLYAGTWGFDPEASLPEIWASPTGDAGDWSPIDVVGIAAGNWGVVCFGAHDGGLYAGTANLSGGTQVWRTLDSTQWEQVTLNGFGDPSNKSVTALAGFEGYLYAATGTSWDAPRAQLWRCQQCDGSDWTLVRSGDYHFTDTWRKASLEMHDGYLYHFIGHQEQGLEVWRAADGLNWEEIAYGGFGDRNNIYTYFDNATLAFQGRIYVGTENVVTGGEVWVWEDSAPE